NEGKVLIIEQVREEINQPLQQPGDVGAQGANAYGKGRDPQQPGLGREISSVSREITAQIHTAPCLRDRRAMFGRCISRFAVRRVSECPLKSRYRNCSFFWAICFKIERGCRGYNG